MVLILTFSLLILKLILDIDIWNVILDFEYWFWNFALSIQPFVSIPHSRNLHFSKLLQNFIIKYWCNSLSAIDIYHSSQNQKENSTILVIIHKKWKLKGEKKLEKWDVHFVSKPNTCHLGHLKTTKMSEIFLGGRPS